MAFSGRFEAMRAPTTENDTIRVARATIAGPDREDFAQCAPVEEAEDQAGHSQCYAQRTQRPGKVGGSAAAHSTDSSPLFPCPYCHNAARSGLKVLLAYGPAPGDETRHKLAVALVWDAEAFPEFAFFEGELEGE